MFCDENMVRMLRSSYHNFYYCCNWKNTGIGKSMSFCRWQATKLLPHILSGQSGVTLTCWPCRLSAGSTAPQQRPRLFMLTPCHSTAIEKARRIFRTQGPTIYSTKDMNSEIPNFTKTPASSGGTCSRCVNDAINEALRVNRLSDRKSVV